jgi:hypothetical protein
VSALCALGELQSLDIRLSTLVDLRSLNLGGTRVSGVAALLTRTNLRTLNAHQLRIDHFGVLEQWANWNIVSPPCTLSREDQCRIFSDAPSGDVPINLFSMDRVRRQASA